MSDQQEKLDGNAEIEVISRDAIIKIEVSGAYYGRLMTLISNFTMPKGKEVITILKELETREPANAFEYDLITLMMLHKSIEDAAREQKLTGKTTVDELIKDVQEGDPES